MKEIISPIGNMEALLGKLKQNAEGYKSKINKNEAATRAILIDPVLQSLGWNTADPDMIEFERIYGDTRVDYALYDPSGKVVAIVEAKALGVNLNDAKYMFKLFTYAFNYGIQNIFLTNGQVWQHFSNAQPGKIDPITYDLYKDDLAKVAAYLISTLDAALYWRQIDTLVDLEPESIPASKVPEPESGFIPLSEIIFPLRGKKPPKLLRMPNGQIKKIKYWRDILNECCEFVLENVAKLDIPVPDKAGKKLTLIGNERPDGNVAFQETKFQGQTVYIYLNYSSDNCVSNAIHILEKLPESKISSIPALKF